MQNIKNIFSFYQSSGVYDRVILKGKNVQNQASLENLIEKVICLKDYYNKKENQLVFSDGHFDTKIMVIGDAPNVSDEVTGKPFSGEVGILLDKMLNAIQLDKTKIYLTNIVNFRLPDNKKIEDADIKKFKPLILEHIKIINPKIILLLGTSVLNTLHMHQSISKARGKWLELKIDDCIYNCMPSYHPSFLLRQPQQKRNSWEDLKKFKKKIIEDNLC